MAMAATQQEKVKWEGKAIARLKSCKAEQIWPLWADFCGVQRWFPNLATSCFVQGEAENEVGSVRLCVGSATEGLWAKEKLVIMDHEKRVMRYEVVENNAGLKGYAATIRVVDEEDGGCKVEWSFEADVVEELGPERLQGYIQNTLDSAVKRMEEAVLLRLP